MPGAPIVASLLLVASPKTQRRQPKLQQLSFLMCQAIRQRKEVFEFLGNEIPLNRRFGVLTSVTKEQRKEQRMPQRMPWMF